MSHLDLENVKLSSGAHKPTSGECCVLELYSCRMKQKWSDHPADVSPFIADFLRRWNDAMNDEDRQQLKQTIPWLVGTKTNDADETTRSWMMLDWLIHVHTPAWMDLAKLPEHAAALRALTAIIDQATCNTALPVVNAARDAACAIANAHACAIAIAIASAYASARAIARAIANAHARAIAIANAHASAYANAHASAYAYANASAPEVRALTVEMQASALDLVKRLCEVGRSAVLS